MTIAFAMTVPGACVCQIMEERAKMEEMIRADFEEYQTEQLGRRPMTWASKLGFIPQGIDPDSYIMGEDKRTWEAWQASRKQALEMRSTDLAILATFAHEVLMGAIQTKTLKWKARAALGRAGLLILDDVVNLTDDKKTT